MMHELKYYTVWPLSVNGEREKAKKIKKCTITKSFFFVAFFFFKYHFNSTPLNLYSDPNELAFKKDYIFIYYCDTIILNMLLFITPIPSYLSAQTISLLMLLSSLLFFFYSFFFLTLLSCMTKRKFQSLT